MIRKIVSGPVCACPAGIGEHRATGDLLVLGAVVVYGFYIAAARAFGGVLPVRHYAALVYLGAALACALALPWSMAGEPLLLPRHSILAIVALALVPTMLGHTAVQAAARTLSPSRVALVSPGETVGGLLIGALLLGARPSGRDLGGALLILAGVVVAVLGGRPRMEDDRARDA